MSRQGVTTQHSAPSHLAKGIVFHFITSLGCGRLSFGDADLSNTSTLNTQVHAKLFTHTHRELIVVTRPLNIIMCSSVQLKIHILTDPWSSHNWHKRFFCCGYWLMKLKANEILSQERTSAEAFLNEHTMIISSLKSFLRQRLFTYT